MATKASAVKPPTPASKQPDVDALLARLPAAKRLPRVRAAAVLAALELVKGERPEDALRRRGLKTR
jgi:hypothetical protein